MSSDQYEWVKGRPSGVEVEPRVLVCVETPYTQLGQSVVIILESLRLKYRVQVLETTTHSSGRGTGRTLPTLTHGSRGRFTVIIFERLESYLSLDLWNKQLLEKYCIDFNVGIIAFAHPDQQLYMAQVNSCFNDYTKHRLVVSMFV